MQTNNSLAVGIDLDNGDIILEHKKPSSVAERFALAIPRIAEEFPQAQIVLVGNEQKIVNSFGKIPENATIINATAYCPPSQKIKKPVQGSSLNNLVQETRNGNLLGFFSIGDTSKVGIESARLGRIRGVEKPALITPIPVYPSGNYLLVDIGATSLNQNQKPKSYSEAVDEFSRELICQGIMTAVYSREVLHIARPRLGLLTIGEENHKGSDLVLRTHERFKELESRGLSELIDYRGKIEPYHSFAGEVDIALVDGHTGNLMLKLTESIINLIKQAASQELSNLGILEKALMMPAAFVLKNSPRIKQFAERFSPERYNGAVLLGYNGTVVKGHGNSKSRGIYHGIRRTIDSCSMDLSSKIEQALERYMPE